MLGPDLYNGSSAQLIQFRTQTGATYPLLLQGAAGAGNENLLIPYGQWDNYVVINKQGIIRYHAYDRWPHGNRYHVGEIRGSVDSLVSGTVAVGDEPSTHAYRLNASPNPFRNATTLEFTNPTEGALEARVTVHDLAGRRIATLWDGPVPRGSTRLTWGGRGENAARVAPGVYVVRARIAGVEFTRRVVTLR